MAGLFLYTLDHRVFSQLTTAPTPEQGDLLAGSLLEDLDDLVEEFEDESEAAMWPRDRDALSELITRRLAQPDWYSDLSHDNASVWDNVVFSLQDDPGEAMGIDFQCSDYASIYWDCAEIAEKQGVSMMATLGWSAFRYFGKPAAECSFFPMYSLLVTAEAQRLLAQLEAAAPHFASLPDGEGTPHEQFFQGLLPIVQQVSQNERVLWVQTDT